MKTRRLRSYLVGLLAVCVALVGVLAITGCDQVAETNPQAEVQTDTEQVSVCFVELVDNGAFQTMMEGFKEGMKNAGYDNVTYNVENAQGDTATLNQIASSLKDSDYDVIVPIVTPAAQACVNAGITIPMVFISVTDPVAAGLTTSLELPDKGITGTSNVADVEAIFDFGKSIDEKILDNKVGILYSSGETNAVVTANNAKVYLESKGVEVVEKTVSNSSEVQQTGTQLASEVGCIYVPVDSTVQSAMAQLTSAALDAKVPVLGTDPVMVQSGCLESVSASNMQLGEESAKLAIQAITGTDISHIPIVVVSADDYEVNKQTADALGLTVPTEYDGHQVTVVDSTKQS